MAEHTPTPVTVTTPRPCGCRLEPVKDATEPCDLCSEATGTNDGIGWRIVRCPLHKAAPDLLEACRWLYGQWLDYADQRVLTPDEQSHKEQARAALEAAGKGE